MNSEHREFSKKNLLEKFRIHDCQGILAGSHLDIDTVTHWLSLVPGLFHKEIYIKH